MRTDVVSRDAAPVTEVRGASTRIAFLGYPTTHDRARTDEALSLADNRMQHGYLRALRSTFDSVTAFSTVIIPPQHDGQDAVTEDGLTWRHPVRRRSGLLRPLLKAADLSRALSEWARARPEDVRILLYYNTFLIHGIVGWWLARRHGVRIVPIAITLPYRSPDDRATWSGRAQEWLTARLLRRVDGLVAISPFLGAKIAPHVRPCVIRGAAAGEIFNATTSFAAREPGPYRIVYAGNLTARYNLRSAVEMIHHLPPNEYRLDIYGRGALEPWLRSVAERDSAVRLHGVLGEEEIARVISKADVLLALLRPDDHLARYSFPSKLFECLASGVPTVTTDLPTLDEEMRRCLVIADPEDPVELARLVAQLCERSKAARTSAAIKGWRYLEDNATWSSVGVQLHRYLTQSGGSRQ